MPYWLIYFIESRLPAEMNKETRDREKRFVYHAPVQFVISILAVELTLWFNSITGVYTLNSTSQLIPFLFGITQLIFVLYKLRDRREFEKIWYDQQEPEFHNKIGVFPFSVPNILPIAYI
jgi:hypothetical protein